VTLLCGYGDLKAVDENFMDMVVHLAPLLELRRSYEKKNEYYNLQDM
jgi:hypothetical protein